MNEAATAMKGKGFDALGVLESLADPIIVVDDVGAIVYANPAAEAFFAMGQSVMRRHKLADLVPFASPLLAVVAQARESEAVVTEYDIELQTLRTGVHQVNVRVSPMLGHGGMLTVQLEERTIASRMDRQLTHRGAVRSINAMAAVLAHEVKNPLSGIRGAAQILEQMVGDGDRELTRLICDETDRICGLVERMEAFADPRAISRDAVNIHEVLDHVRRVAEAGFASHVRFEERFDPSLPPVLGNRDQLIQVFLNLVKNAAEAVPETGGKIVLETAFRHGVRLAAPGGKERINLPIEVSVRDNGSGIPADIRSHLFDPFVTTKSGGSGLGLALTAKIIGDHGGIVEADSDEQGTVLRVNLPVYRGGEGEQP